MKHTECKECELSNSEIATKLQPNCNNLQQGQQDNIFPMEIVAGKCPIEAGGNCPLKLQGEWIRKEDVIHLLERWSDGYSYIEIPTDDAIKAIKKMGNGAEKVKIKSTKDLINNIAGFDVSGIKPLPEYKDEITDAEQKGGANNE